MVKARAWFGERRRGLLSGEAFDGKRSGLVREGTWEFLEVKGMVRTEEGKGSVLGNSTGEPHLLLDEE